MRKVFALVLAPFLLVACGIDGPPTPPKVSAETTVGVNSRTGPFQKTVVGIEFGG